MRTRVLVTTAAMVISGAVGVAVAATVSAPLPTVTERGALVSVAVVPVPVPVPVPETMAPPDTDVPAVTPSDEPAGPSPESAGKTPVPMTAVPVPPAPSTSGVTQPVSVTTRAPAEPGPLRIGSEGAEVRALETRLTELRFDVGAIDGKYDAALSHAVMAFQKQQDLPRDGVAGPVTLARVAAATPGTPIVRADRADRVEIDLRRQIIQVWKGGQLARVLSTSTGSGQRYVVNGDVRVAGTPTGTYKAFRRVKGADRSPLGVLYDPVYFNGGIAIHGAPSVPAGPASHGCARVPMHSSRWIYDNVPDGMTVYVVSGIAHGAPPQAPVG